MTHPLHYGWRWVQSSLGIGLCLCTPVFAVYLPSIGLEDQLLSEGLATWVGMPVDGLIWGIFIAPRVGERKDSVLEGKRGL